MKYIFLNEVDSTNTYLKREYKNFDNLTFVSASFQTNGHGRYQRTWNASEGESILLSYLLKESKYIENFSYISMFTAAHVVQYLENKGIKDVTIKWPNDVYVGGKKICGILLEGEIPNYIVVGIGLNINQSNFDNVDLRHPATSLKILNNGENYSQEDETKSLISLISSFWDNFSDDWRLFDNFIKNHNYLKNKHVKVTNQALLFEGIVADIDSECNLLINNGQEIVKICAGEIEIL